MQGRRQNMSGMQKKFLKKIEAIATIFQKSIKKQWEKAQFLPPMPHLCKSTSRDSAQASVHDYGAGLSNQCGRTQSDGT
jgi:hypothetical protein